MRITLKLNYDGPIKEEVLKALQKKRGDLLCILVGRYAVFQLLEVASTEENVHGS